MWQDCEWPRGWLERRLIRPRGGQKGEVKGALNPCTWKSQKDVLLTPGSLAWNQQMAFPIPLLPPLCGCWVKHGSPALISGFAVVHIFYLRFLNKRASASLCRTINAPETEPRDRGSGGEGWRCCQPLPLESHQQSQEQEGNWRCRHLTGYTTNNLVIFISVFHKIMVQIFGRSFWHLLHHNSVEEQ